MCHYITLLTAVQDSTDFHKQRGLTLIFQGSLNDVCPSRHMGLIYNRTAILSRFYLHPLTCVLTDARLNQKRPDSPQETLHVQNQHIYFSSCRKALMIISAY